MSLAPLALALALVSSGGAPAPPAPAAAPTPPTGCTAPEHRGFDFWVGTWEVTAGGKRAGGNVIEAILGGCALRESWTGARGNQGTSFSWWEPADRRWHQLWLDDDGLVLRLAGERRGTALVLEGVLPGPGGAPARQRVTWTPLPGGKVRQHWESSPDGMTWRTVFDGLYERRAAR